MKRIKELLDKRDFVSAKGKDCTRYTYLVQEGIGEEEATTTRKYEVGEAVRTWFGDFNQHNIGKLCQKCLKPWNEKNAIEHEFCHLPKRINQ